MESLDIYYITFREFRDFFKFAKLKFREEKLARKFSDVYMLAIN